MGKIFIKGLGNIEIQGDVPNEQEQQIIIEAIGVDLKPAPKVPARAPAARGPEPAKEGPFGIMPAEGRQAVRQTIEDAPGLFGFLAEMTPATIGAVGGGTVGGLFGGPPGAMGGAIGGGLLGEAIGQETGVAPASDLNLALAGAGPVIGRAAAGAARLGGRAAGGLVKMLPPARVALAKTQAKAATKNLEALGARLLTKGKETASQLFDIARGSGLKISGQRFLSTRNALRELRAELEPLSGFQEVNQAMNVIDTVAKTLSGKKIVTNLNKAQLKALEMGKPGVQRIGKGGETKFVIDDPLSFDTIISARQQVGVAIRKAQRAAGVRLGSSKKVFAAISNDVDSIAKGVAGPARAGVARLAKKATERAKLEFAVRDLEGLFSRFTKITKEGDAVIDFKGLLKRVTDITDAKHPNFDKNFVAALGGQMGALKANLATLVKTTKGGSPGGPGSIVLRGRLVGAMAGGLAGLGIEGPMGGAVGAMVGTSIPEMLTGIFMTKTGSSFLMKAARLGRGEVNFRAWTVLGEIMSRLASETREQESKAAPVPAGPTTNPATGLQEFAKGSKVEAQLGAAGRGGDSIVGHLTLGEVVIPERVLDPELSARIARALADNGLNPEDFIVGGPDRRNPTTGLREFFGPADVGSGAFGAEDAALGASFGGEFEASLDPGGLGDFGGGAFDTPDPSAGGVDVGQAGGFNPAIEAAPMGIVDPPGVATGAGVDIGQAGNFGFGVTSFDEGKGVHGFPGFLGNPAAQPGSGIGDPAHGQGFTSLQDYIDAGGLSVLGSVLGFASGLPLGLVGMGLTRAFRTPEEEALDPLSGLLPEQELSPSTIAGAAARARAERANEDPGFLSGFGFDPQGFNLGQDPGLSMTQGPAPPGITADAPGFGLFSKGEDPATRGLAREPAPAPAPTSPLGMTQAEIHAALGIPDIVGQAARAFGRTPGAVPSPVPGAQTAPQPPGIFGRQVDPETGSFLSPDQTPTFGLPAPGSLPTIPGATSTGEPLASPISFGLAANPTVQDVIGQMSDLELQETLERDIAPHVQEQILEELRDRERTGRRSPQDTRIDPLSGSTLEFDPVLGKLVRDLQGI